MSENDYMKAQTRIDLLKLIYTTSPSMSAVTAVKELAILEAAVLPAPLTSAPGV